MLNHPNIVRFLGVYSDHYDDKYIVCEYCPLGALNLFLQEKENQQKMTINILQDM